MRCAPFVLVALAIPATATAAESPWPTSVEIGARVGYGPDVALGDEHTLTAWTTQYFERIATIPEPSLHVWMSFGIRAAFRGLA